MAGTHGVTNVSKSLKFLGVQILAARLSEGWAISERLEWLLSNSAYDGRVAFAFLVICGV